MSELVVTIIGGGVWVLIVVASFMGCAWLQQWLGWKGPVASFAMFVLSILLAVGLGGGLVAFINRVFALLSRRKADRDD